MLKFGNSRHENCSQSHAPAAVDSSISQLDSDDHSQDPGAAAVALYSSKGLFRFEHLSDSDLHDAAAAVDYESLPKKAQLLYQQIQAQEVTPELQAKRVQAFQSQLGAEHFKFFGCAACGVFLGTADASLFKWTNDLDRFVLNDIDTNEYHALPTSLRVPVSETEWASKDLRLAVAVVEHGGQLYHLHREFCNVLLPTLEAQLCVECIKSKINNCSLAGGRRLGNAAALKLEPLSYIERILLAPVRNCTHALKLYPDGQQRLMAHSITFAHDGQEQVCKALRDRVESLPQYLSISFVLAKTQKLDTIASKVFSGKMLTARPWVMLQWMLVMSYLHEGFPQFRVAGLDSVNKDLERLPEALMNSSVSSEVLDEVLKQLQQTSMGDVVQDLQGLPDILKSVGSVCKDPEAIAADAIERADVGQTRQDVNGPAVELGGASQPMLDDQAENVFISTHSMVCNKQGSCNNLDVNDVVQQQLKASKDILSVSVGRETEPLNTFSENDALLAGVAFNVFLLGRKGVGCKGSMSNVLVKHLLTHYTQQAGCDSQLCFTLFNQLQIHAATKSVSASVKAHPDVFAKFSAFQADEVAFEKRITAAIANPKSVDAKALVTELQGMLKFSGARHVPYSSEARKSLIPQLYAYSQELNSGYVFVTISPHDVSDWRTLRLTRRLDVPLTELPADDAAMVGDSILEVELDAEMRSRLVSANPAASAILFRQVVLVILEHIFGVKPCRSIRTSPLFGDGVVLGIFGTLTGFVGVIEVDFSICAMIAYCRHKDAVLYIFIWFSGEVYLLQSSAFARLFLYYT